MTRHVTLVVFGACELGLVAPRRVTSLASPLHPPYFAAQGLSRCAGLHSVIRSISLQHVV